MADDIDTSRLTDDQRRALEMSRGPSMSDRAGDAVQAVTGARPGEIADDVRGAAAKYGPALKTAALDTATSMFPTTVGAARAASAFHDRFGGQDQPPPTSNPWDSVMTKDRPMLSMERDVQPGDIGPPRPPMPGQAAGAGAPVDYMKRAADETGNSVNTAPVDIAQGQANQVMDQGADIEGAKGANAAANAQAAMGANRISDAQYDQQHGSIDDHIQRLNNRAAAIDEDVANARVDPDRKWKNMSTGGKVLSQLAVTFGALGQAFGQKNNIGLDNLHKSIDDDVDEQKREIESKKGLSSNLKGLVGEYHKQGLDLDAAQAKAKAAHWDDALKESQIFVDQARGPLAQQQALQKQADIAKAAAEAKVEAQKRVVRQATMDRERAIAGAAQARVAAQKQAYDRSLKEREEKREDIKLGLQAEKQASDEDIARSKVAGAGKTDQTVQAAMGAGDRVAANGTGALAQGVGNPFAYFSSSDAAEKARGVEAYNSSVKAAFHKIAGARTPEAQEHVAAPYLVTPQDSPAVAAKKIALFKQTYGNFVAQPTAPAEDDGEGP